MTVQLTFADVQTPNEYHPIFSDLSPNVVLNAFEYHRKNPQVYEAFKRYAYEARKRWKHFSPRDVFALVRWFTDVPTVGDFKVNNSYVSFFVRLIQLEDSQFKDFFETRKTPGYVFEVAA